MLNTENTKRTGNYTIPTEHLLSYVDFQNTNFVVVILDSLFKTGKSGSGIVYFPVCSVFPTEYVDNHTLGLG
jgi:hypothetical protein